MRQPRDNRQETLVESGEYEAILTVLYAKISHDFIEEQPH